LKSSGRKRAKVEQRNKNNRPPPPPQKKENGGENENRKEMLGLNMERRKLRKEVNV